MTLTNIEHVPGMQIGQVYGLVSGSTIRAKNIFRDIGSGIKNIFGGELKNYTKLLEEARDEATNRMIQEALAKGANAVVNIRFSTSSIAAGAAEIYVYGTAVHVQ